MHFQAKPVLLSAVSRVYFPFSWGGVSRNWLPGPLSWDIHSGLWGARYLGSVPSASEGLNADWCWDASTTQDTEKTQFWPQKGKLARADKLLSTQRLSKNRYQLNLANWRGEVKWHQKPEMSFKKHFKNPQLNLSLGLSNHQFNNVWI